MNDTELNINLKALKKVKESNITHKFNISSSFRLIPISSPSRPTPVRWPCTSSTLGRVTGRRLRWRAPCLSTRGRLSLSMGSPS